MNIFKKIMPDGSVSHQKDQLVDKTVYRSKDLFGDKREITIEHGNVSYRLYITKAGKLILNK